MIGAIPDGKAAPHEYSLEFTSVESTPFHFDRRGFFICSTLLCEFALALICRKVGYFPPFPPFVFVPESRHYTKQWCIKHLANAVQKADVEGGGGG